MKYTHKKYYMPTWYQIKSDGGVFRWFKFAALQQKNEGGGGTIKLKRRTIKLI
jgi:hypothetical protein